MDSHQQSEFKRPVEVGPVQPEALALGQQEAKTSQQQQQHTNNIGCRNDPTEATTTTTTTTTSDSNSSCHTARPAVIGEHQCGPQLAPLASLDLSITEPASFAAAQPTGEQQHQQQAINQSTVNTDTPTLSGYFDCDELSDMVDDSLFEITTAGCLSRTIFGGRVASVSGGGGTTATSNGHSQVGGPAAAGRRDQSTSPLRFGADELDQSVDEKQVTPIKLTQLEQQPKQLPSVLSSGQQPPRGLVALMAQFQPYDYSSTTKVPAQAAAVKYSPSASYGQLQQQLSSGRTGQRRDEPSAPPAPATRSSQRVTSTTTTTTTASTSSATNSGRRKTRSNPDVRDEDKQAQLDGCADKTPAAGQLRTTNPRRPPPTHSSNHRLLVGGVGGAGKSRPMGSGLCPICAREQAAAGGGAKQTKKAKRRRRFAFSLFNLFTGGGGNHGKASDAIDKITCQHHRPIILSSSTSSSLSAAAAAGAGAANVTTGGVGGSGKRDHAAAHLANSSPMSTSSSLSSSNGGSPSCQVATATANSARGPMPAAVRQHHGQQSPAAGTKPRTSGDGGQSSRRRTSGAPAQRHDEPQAAAASSGHLPLRLRDSIRITNQRKLRGAKPAAAAASGPPIGGAPSKRSSSNGTIGDGPLAVEGMPMSCNNKQPPANEILLDLSSRSTGHGHHSHKNSSPSSSSSCTSAAAAPLPLNQDSRARLSYQQPKGAAHRRTSAHATASATAAVSANHRARAQSASVCPQRQNKSVKFSTPPDRVMILSSSGSSRHSGSATLPPADLQPAAPIIKRQVPKSSSYSQTDTDRGLDELLARYDHNRQLISEINEKLKLTDTIASNLSTLDCVGTGDGDGDAPLPLQLGAPMRAVGELELLAETEQEGLIVSTPTANQLGDSNLIKQTISEDQHDDTRFLAHVNNLNFSEPPQQDEIIETHLMTRQSDNEVEEESAASCPCNKQAASKRLTMAGVAMNGDHISLEGNSNRQHQSSSMSMSKPRTMV